MKRAIEVFYDGWCPVCCAVRDRLQRLDRLGLLRFRSIRDPEGLGDLPVPPEQLAARMHVRHLATGKIESGIDAVAAIVARVPALIPLWPVVKLSALIGVGGWLYDQIASRRTIVPTGHCTLHGCALEVESRQSESPDL
jgi:predicted DCC family thiol-disulfide oxidoreductase YuxK